MPRSLRPRPRPVEALPCGSRSTRRTFSPTAARAVARLMAVVVLPTPPFWLAMARIRGRGSDVRGGSGSCSESRLVADTADLADSEDGRFGVGRADEPLDVHVPSCGGCRQFVC